MDSATLTAAKPCFLGRLCAEIKRLVILVMVMGLLIIAGKYYCFDRLDGEIRSRVEQQLRDHYQGLNVSLKSARRIAGRGVELRGLRIAEGGGSATTVLAEIDEVFAECDTRLPDFLTKPLQITALDIHRLKLRAERKPSGRWNLAHLLPLPSCASARRPRATITDSSLEIIDPAQPSGASSALVLRNIELTVDPQEESAGLLQVHGTLAGDHVERMELSGTIDPLTSRWDVRGSVEGLEFSPRLRAALPIELSQSLAPLSSIRGRTFFGFHAQRTDPSTPVAFVIRGKISEGRIDDTRLLEPLTDVEAAIHFDNQGVHIENLSAHCGVTQLEASSITAGYRGDQPIEIDFAGRDVQIERLPVMLFPPNFRQLWSAFHPQGRANVQGRLAFDGQQWRPELSIQCRDLTVSYDRFPYLLTDGGGTIVVRPNLISMDLKTIGGSRVIGCTAKIENPGEHFFGLIEVQSDGAIPIDDRLLAAMDPATQQVVRAFHPRGNASFFARFQRQRPDEPLHRHLNVQLQDCSIQHDRFPYPIDRISGQLILDDDRWVFQNLLGRNDSAEIAAAGTWHSHGQAGRQLALQFQARNVPLAEELRQALPPVVERLWGNLRPRGTLDQLVVGLNYFADVDRWSVEVAADKRPIAGRGYGGAIALEPAWLPSELSNLTGAVRYRDGKVELSNLKAVHNRGTITAEGNCALLADGSCRVELSKLAADQIELAPELLSAISQRPGESPRAFALEGPVNVLGRVGVLIPRDEQPPLLDWDLKLDVEEGRLLAATPVEHIHGGLSINGRQSGEGVFGRGELRVDSAIVRGIQLTQLTGPFWLDGRRLVFGALAERQAQDRPPRPVTGKTLGGILSLDGELGIGGDDRFQVSAALQNADLAEISRQLAPHQHDLSGKVFGSLQATGSASAKHTWRGNGRASLRDADVYKLPEMITLLKLLSIQQPDRTAFTTSNIDFRIQGDDLEFQRIDFSGDAISLKGAGRMNAQRQIDLKFYPLVGREERHLPIFRPLIGETAKQFMVIEVTGTLDQPEIHRTVFPRLDAQLQQLFPELARDELIDPKMPLISAPREMLKSLRLLPSR